MVSKHFLERKIEFRVVCSVKQLLLLALILVLAVYMIWEIYWFNQVDLSFIKWHTHLSFTAFVLFGLWIPFWVFYKYSKAKFKIKLLTGISAVFFALWLAELLLVFTGLNKDYMEIRAGYYQSPYNRTMGNLYHRRSPNTLHYLNTPEYKFQRKTNNLGFSDKDWQPTKSDTVERIITFGDSFTEGDGARVDSSYPKLLEKLLPGSVEVLNAGVCGSDPFFNFKNFEDYLSTYQSDVVIQVISSNDILFDFMIRGGMERFQQEGTLHLKKAPSWEIFYASSYVFRAIMPLLNLDINNPIGIWNTQPRLDKLNDELSNLVKQYETVAASKKSTVLWVILPMRDEFINNRYQFDYSDFKRTIGALPNSGFVDLLPLYIEKAKKESKSPLVYYWKFDGHHNATGYRMMAECIADYLRQRYPHWPVYKNQP